MDCRDGVLGYQGTAPCEKTGRMWRKVGHFRQREQRCEGPKAGPFLLYSRLGREASVAEGKGDGVTEVAGPGYIEPP